MKIDVYDSYANNSDGHLIHFDVFVKSGSHPEDALHYGRKWLSSIGESPDVLEQERCNFCHTETANPEVKSIVELQGYFILQMEGCPEPV